MSSYFLVFNVATNTLYRENVVVNRYVHRTCSGEILQFEVTPSGLSWSVPYLLLDNIFYFQDGDLIYFSRHIDDLKSFTSPDINANKLLRKHEFLPHAQTQLSGVNIICSFLSYLAGREGVVVTACYPAITSGEFYSIDSLMDILRQAFKRQVERVNQDTWILPLSGGMDSRLLLNIALEYKDIDLQFYTVGTRSCGDIRVAKGIAKHLGMEGRHKILYLEDLSLNDLLVNYRLCDYLLPLDRVLTKPLNYFFKKGAVISGLYGDVIFADNVNKSISYEDYYHSEGFFSVDAVDSAIVAAYNKLPKLPKVQRILLRCQKLTRQSFSISEGFDFVTPFADPNVLACASNIGSKSIYPNLISRHMRSDLKSFIHQSTLSYFTHPVLLRTFERKLFKLIGHPARSPYFDSELLHKLGIQRNEVPLVR